jgi:hypothetical protein
MAEARNRNMGYRRSRHFLLLVIRTAALIFAVDDEASLFVGRPFLEFSGVCAMDSVIIFTLDYCHSRYEI